MFYIEGRIKHSKGALKMNIISQYQFYCYQKENKLIHHYFLVFKGGETQAIEDAIDVFLDNLNNYGQACYFVVEVPIDDRFNETLWDDLVLGKADCFDFENEKALEKLIGCPVDDVTVIFYNQYMNTTGRGQNFSSIKEAKIALGVNELQQ